MNEYSVYYCGYNYYFLEEGKLKKQININVAQDYEVSPLFKSNHIFTGRISPLEQEKIEFDGDFNVQGNLSVGGKRGRCKFRFLHTKRKRFWPGGRTYAYGIRNAKPRPRIQRQFFWKQCDNQHDAAVFNSVHLEAHGVGNTN